VAVVLKFKWGEGVESSCRGGVVLALPKYVVGWVPAQWWDGSPQLHIFSPV